MNTRLDATKQLTGQEVQRAEGNRNTKLMIYKFQPKPIDVSVIQHQMQRYAVWFGGSMLASTVTFTEYSLVSLINAGLIAAGVLSSVPHQSPV